MIDLNKTHQLCSEEFEKLFDTEDSESISCDIWRAFSGENEEFDNSIGENFNQLLWSIKDNWFDNESNGKLKFDFYNYTYIFWLYLVVARVYEIFDQFERISKSDLFERKRVSLRTFNEINLWAKFTKHPKEFILCHWPEYKCEGEYIKKDIDTILITSSYLKDHYNAADDDRPEILKNNTNVVVQFPKPIRILEGFVSDFYTFRDIICENAIIIETLEKESNIAIKKEEIE